MTTNLLFVSINYCITPPDLIIAEKGIMPVLRRGPVVHHGVHERLDAHVAVRAAQAGHQAIRGRVAGDAAEGRPQRLCRHVGEAVGGNDRVRQLRVEVACRFHQRFPGLGKSVRSPYEFGTTCCRLPIFGTVSRLGFQLFDSSVPVGTVPVPLCSIGN